MFHPKPAKAGTTKAVKHFDCLRLLSAVTVVWTVSMQKSVAQTCSRGAYCMVRVYLFLFFGRGSHFTLHLISTRLSSAFSAKCHSPRPAKEVYICTHGHVHTPGRPQRKWIATSERHTHNVRVTVTIFELPGTVTSAHRPEEERGKQTSFVCVPRDHRG